MSVLGVVCWFLVIFLGISMSAENNASLLQVSQEQLAEASIMSGWEIEEALFPYQFSLRMINEAGQVFGCGGSIIHPEWGLTAAHCTASRSTLVVRVVGMNVTKPEAIFETSEFYNHPMYNKNRLGEVQPHDIGLVKFGRSIPFDDHVQPIRLQRSSDRNRDYSGRLMIAARAGWRVNFTAGLTEAPNWVYLQGKSNHLCWLEYGRGDFIVESTICAEFYNVTSLSNCSVTNYTKYLLEISVDSDGTLVIEEEDGVKTQVGVTSFVSGNKCNTPTSAGFVRPGHYHEWFTEVTGINFDWNLQENETTIPKPTKNATEAVTIGEQATATEVLIAEDVADTTEGKSTKEDTKTKVTKLTNTETVRPAEAITFSEAVTTAEEATTIKAVTTTGAVTTTTRYTVILNVKPNTIEGDSQVYSDATIIRRYWKVGFQRISIYGQ